MEMTYIINNKYEQIRSVERIVLINEDVTIIYVFELIEKVILDLFGKPNTVNNAIDKAREMFTDFREDECIDFINDLIHRRILLLEDNNNQ